METRRLMTNTAKVEADSAASVEQHNTAGGECSPADDRAQFWYPVDKTTDLTGQVAPPGNARVWELSWSRRKGLMRIRLQDGREWYFRTAAGKARVLHADNDTGRLFLRGKVVVQNGDQAFFYKAKEDKRG